MTKSDLRKQSLLKRNGISDKLKKDTAISNNLFSFTPFQEAETVLVYVSSKGEADTKSIISYCFENNKKVAVPYCKDKDGNMEFYLIDSFDCLNYGCFGINEPDINKCVKLTDFSNSLIIVPGLSFDLNGNRLGYGKGYYDRFLKKYAFISVGLCYNSLIADQVPAEKHDMRVDYLITENGIYNTDNGGKNG